MLKEAISRFAITFIVTAITIVILGYLIFAEQEYALWSKIGVSVSLLAALISAFTPTKNKSIYIVLPLLVALAICYFLFASY